MTTTAPKGALRQLTAADGHTLDCWVEPARGTRKGGLVILQEIFGVTDQLKGVAAMYAGQGYDVAIPALFDRREREAVIPFDQGPRGRDIMQSLDAEDTLKDIAAAADAVRGGGKVAVLGFCWGGGLALRAAQKLDIAAAVSFYGTRMGGMLDSPLKAPFQGHFGSKDDHTPAELVEKVRAAFPAAEIFMYEAGHAFANDARPSYVAQAADDAHARAAAFLARHIG